MNNGLHSGFNRESRARRTAIYGQPKGHAKVVEGRGTTRPTWEYMGVRFRPRKNAGWNSGTSWEVIEPLGITPASHKPILMVRIEQHLASK